MHFVLRKYHLFRGETRSGQHLTEGVHWAVDHLPSAAKLQIYLLFSKRVLIIFKKCGSFVVMKGKSFLFSKRVSFWTWTEDSSSLPSSHLCSGNWLLPDPLSWNYTWENNAINITNHFLLHAPVLTKIPSAYICQSKQSDCVDQIRFGRSKALNMSSVRV